MPEVGIPDLVEACVNGDYQIPEFQRDFVWKPSQLAAFVDSLSSGFPVGCLTVWSQVTGEGEERIYVVDGQQRLTALCVMFGRRPNWKDERKWQVISDTSRQYLNVSPDGEASFGRKRGGGCISLPLHKILANESDEEVTDLVRDTLDATRTTRELARTNLYEKAKQVWNLRRSVLPVIEVTSEDPMEVAEMYQRLNLEGTKIREPDILLAFIAVKNEGWVKGVFRAFLEDLAKNTNKRWSLRPEDLLRCMTIIDSATPRVRGLKNEREFWESGCKNAFDRVKDAINDILPRLERYGVYAINEVPSTYALISLFTFHARFSREKNYDFGAVFRWFLSANVASRYTGAGLQLLTEDTKKFMKIDNPSKALEDLEIPKDELRRALDEEFAEPFKKGSPGALLLKVLLWDKGIDWRKGGKLSQYPPLEWHHIIPPKVLKNMYAEDASNHIANRTLLSEDANKQFKDRPPWIYAPSIIAEPARLESHFISASYAKAFTAGKAINKPDELLKFLTERLRLVQRNAKQLLGLAS
jgi:predicted nucleic acid-binding protein